MPTRNVPMGRGWWDRVAGPVATVILSLLGMAQALKVWDWRPGTPLGLTGDAPWMATLIRGYLDYGPYADTPLFGAPFALNTGWSSTGNDLHVWILTALGTFSHDPFTVMAVYFFLTFPLSALTMYWLCRKYEVARAPAVMAGVLFSLIPGHQERFPHLFLAAYWAVPFAAWVIIETARGRSVLATDATGRSRRRLAHVAHVLMLIAIGLGDVYYVAFTLVIAVPIAVLRQIRRPDFRELRLLSIPLLVMVVPTLISLAVARRRADRDVLTGGMPFGRSFVDSDRWAGQIFDLVMPWPGYRVAAFGQRSQAYDALTGTTGEVSAIGGVAVLGLIGMLVVVGSALLRGRLVAVNPLIAVLAVASLLAIAFFTRGGLGALTAFLLTPQIRTWSRLFLFIGLFGLLAAGWFVTQLGRRAGGRQQVYAVSAVLVLLGVLDQTNPGRAPDYGSNRAQLATLAAFDDHVQQALGPGCTIFVLPVVGFPEVNDALWSDLMSLGLASDDLHWSFGAIKGTAPADWQLGLATNDPPRLINDIAALNYCGVVVESSLGQRSPLLAAELPRLLGPAVATSSDKRYTAYSLKEVRGRLESRVGIAGIRARSAAALHPVLATLKGAYAVDEVGGRRYPLGPGPSIALSNMTGAPVQLQVRISVLGAAEGSAELHLDGLGGKSPSVVVPPRTRRDISMSVTAPSGLSSLDLVSVGGTGDWDRFMNRSALASVQSMSITPVDTAINAGVDLPSP